MKNNGIHALLKENKDLKRKLAEALSNREADTPAVSEKARKKILRKGEDDTNRVLIETMNEGAVTLDLEGIVTYCNRRLTKMLGVPIRKIVNSPMESFVEPKDLPVFDLLLGKGFKKDISKQIGLKNNKGRIIPVQVSCCPSAAEKEKSGICMVFTDLTEIHRANQGLIKANFSLERKVSERTKSLVGLNLRLQESQEKYRALVKNAPTAIFEINYKTNKFETVNDAMALLSGYSRNELLSMSVLDFLDDENKSVFPGRMDKTRKAKKTESQVEYKVKTKDGRIVHALLNIKFKLNKKGRPIGAMVVGHDITERKKAEEERTRLSREIEKRAAELDATISSMSTGLIVYDQTGKATYSNSVAKELLPKELLPHENFLYDTEEEERDGNFRWETEEGRPFPPERIPLSRALHGESTHDVAIVAAFPYQKLWISVSAAPIRTPDGQLLGVVSSFVDRTGHKKAEIALEESEQHYRSLFENTLQGVVCHDAVGTIISMNSAAEDVLGKTQGLFLGSSSVQEDRYTIREDGLPFPGIEHPAMVSLRTGKPVQNITMGIFHQLKQEYRWISIDAVPLFRPGEEKPYRVYTIFSDITDHKKAEEALHESEARYKAIVETQTEFVARYQIGGLITFVNDSLCRFFHCKPEDFYTRSILEYIHEDEREKLASSIASLDMEHPFFIAEARVILPDGRVTIQNWTHRILFDAAGKFTEYQFNGRDITDRKMAEEELCKNEERLRLAQESAGLGIWDWNVKTGDLEFTPELNKLYGLPPGTIKTYQDWCKRVHPDDISGVEVKRDERIKKHKQFDLEFRGWHSSGEYRWISTKGGAVYDEAGNAVRVFGVNIDITDRKMAEEALSHHSTILEGINRVLTATLTTQTEKELGLLCLKIGQELTKSKMGYIGRINENDIEDIAFSGPVNSKNTIHGVNFKMHSAFGRVLSERKPAFTNNLDGHPDSIGIPSGHPQMDSFLIAPLIFESRTMGVIAFANRPGGYTQFEQETLEILTPVIVEAFMRKWAEDALRESEERFRSVLDNSADVIYRQDLQTGRYGYISPSSEKVLGFSPGELMDLDANAARDMIHANDLQTLSNAQRLLEETGSAKAEYRQINKKGDYRWVSNHMTLIKDADGRPLYMDGSIRNISTLKRTEERLIYLSFHDKVTDLYNLSFFEEELRRMDTQRELPLSIIIGDMNNLKLTNDAFGHQRGNELLKMVADSMKVVCRGEDVIARWGGDEFSVILPRTDLQTAEQIAGRIQEECINRSKDFIRCSISLGVAVKETMDQDIEGVVRLAEERMYKNKMMERDRNRNEIVSAMLKKIGSIDHETTDHINRLQFLAAKTGKIIGLSNKQIDDLKLCATLHDIGKAAIPADILSKPGELSSEEWVQMKKHAEIGYHIGKSLPDLSMASDAILQHHENWDGTGYPQGLKQEQIPLLVRILRIIDSYDVMTHERVYKKPYSQEIAIGELMKGSGTMYDPELVEMFVNKVVNRVWMDVIPCFK